MAHAPQSPRRRQLLLALVGLTGIGVTLLVRHVLRGQEHERIEAQFMLDAEARCYAIDREVNQNVQAVQELASFYTSSKLVERYEFTQYTQPLLKRLKTVRTLLWAPYVLAKDRAAHEESVRKTGIWAPYLSAEERAPAERSKLNERLPEYHISEREDEERATAEQLKRNEHLPKHSISEREESGKLGDADPREYIPKLRDADQRDYYIPACYAEPMDRSRKALGFDLASEPVRRETLLRARDSGTVSASGGVTLVLDPERQASVLVAVPVYRKDQPASTVEERRANIEGYTVGSLRIPEIVRDVLQQFTAGSLDVAVYDETGGARDPLFVPEPRGDATAAGDPPTKDELRYPKRIDKFGRRWLIECAATPDYVVAHATAISQTVLLFGLALTSMLVALLWTLTGRAARVQELVDQRTGELRDSEERFRQLAENIDEVFWIWSVDGRQNIYVSPAFVALWGRSVESLQRNPWAWLEAIHDEDRARVQAAFLGKAATGSYDEEYRILRPDGSMRWIRDRGFPIQLSSGRVYRIAGLAEDITEQKNVQAELTKYQENLRSLASALSLAEEGERRDLALDLHDGLSQILNVAEMKLGMARRTTDARQLAELLQEIARLVREADECGRTLTFQLSPPALYDLGFTAAAEWLFEDMKKRYGLQVILEDDLQPKPIDEPIRVTLFRCLRELLINVAKHAAVDRARVRLRRHERIVRVTVSDAGAGFDPATVVAGAGGRGFGLFGTRERLRYLGGGLRIRSRPGRGTTVAMYAPLSPEE